MMVRFLPAGVRPTARRNTLRFTLIFFAMSGGSMSGVGQGGSDTATSLQGYLSKLKSWKADFRQIYDSGSIRQEEAGTVWLQKPGKMRWEYKDPDDKIFLADGKNTYFFVPSDNQVTVRKLTEEDLTYTPFGFLLGATSLIEDFVVNEMPPGSEDEAAPRLLELAPRRPLENVASMALELHPETMRIVSLTVREYTGGISRFEFRDVVENPRIPKSVFEFKIPKGVEVIRIEEP